MPHYLVYLVYHRRAVTRTETWFRSCFSRTISKSSAFSALFHNNYAIMRLLGTCAKSRNFPTQWPFSRLSAVWSQRSVHQWSVHPAAAVVHQQVHQSHSSGYYTLLAVTEQSRVHSTSDTSRYTNRYTWYIR